MAAAGRARGNRSVQRLIVLDWLAVIPPLRCAGYAAGSVACKLRKTRRAAKDPFSIPSRRGLVAR
eukprot:10579609-Lingulodinium_polyedra.AAC.1